jgi:hypothetical protein
MAPPARAPAPPHVERVREIVRAVTVRSADAFDLLGRTVQVNGAAPPAWPGLPVHAVRLVERLRQELYQHAYCHTLGAPASTIAPDDAVDGGAAVEAHQRALSAANRGRDRWDQGWVAHAILPAGQVIAERDGMARTLWPGEYVLPGGRGMGTGPGAAVTVFVPRESLTMQPGYYFALGAPSDDLDDRNLARLYWNVSAEGAATLVECLTGALSRYDVPYRLKVQAHPAAFSRVDSAVLFVTRRHFHLVAELAAEAVLPRVRPHLRAATPLCAKPLAPGVAAADDPGGGESFGTHRCAVVAEGIWRAFERGETGEEAGLAAVERAFAERRLDFARPHLNARSADIYELPTAGA